MTYAEKLRDPRWQRKRLEILQRDNFTCMQCGDDKTELHVHHYKYSKDPWLTKTENLSTLCKPCHYVIGEITKDGEIDVIKLCKETFKDEVTSFYIVLCNHPFSKFILTLNYSLLTNSISNKNFLIKKDIDNMESMIKLYRENE